MNQKELEGLTNRQLMACQRIATKLPNNKFSSGLSLQMIQAEINKRIKEIKLELKRGILP